MIIAINITLFVIGLGIWFCLYNAEIVINGGQPGLEVLKNLWEEFTWILPGGWQRKVDYIIKTTPHVENDAKYLTNEDYDHIKELAKSLPGIGHFILMHIFVPLLPNII